MSYGFDLGHIATDTHAVQLGSSQHQLFPRRARNISRRRKFVLRIGSADPRPICDENTDNIYWFESFLEVKLPASCKR